MATFKLNDTKKRFSICKMNRFFYIIISPLEEEANFGTTGLTTKDETAETTIWMLFCMFSYIHDSLQLQTCFFLCSIIKKPFKEYVLDRRNNLTITHTYSKSFRSVLQPYPL